MVELAACRGGQDRAVRLGPMAAAVRPQPAAERDRVGPGRPALLEGGASAHDAWMSLAWSAGITIVFFATSFALYQKTAAK